MLKFQGKDPFFKERNEIRTLTPFVVVQLLSCVQFFVTPWTAAYQASLSFTSSGILLKFMSTESVMLSNHLILCCPLHCLPSIFPASGSFPVSWRFASGGQSTGTSVLPSVLPLSIQGWYPLGLTGLISLQSKVLSESSPAPQFEDINSLVLNLLYGPTLTSIHGYWKNHSFD